jgi:DUF4097 and DUF4098 domain-containing protein YvlB
MQRDWGAKILGRIAKFAGIPAILAVVLAGAQAQQTRVFRDGSGWVEERTGTLPVAKNLRVRVEAGSVHVRGGGRGITYVIRTRACVSSEETAKKMFEQYRINPSIRGDAAWITADWAGHGQRKLSGEFTLEVPREMDQVKIETQGGDVDVTNIVGSVFAESGGGNINFDAIGGAVTVETGGGNVRIGNTGGAARVRTGGGNIDLGEIAGSVSLDTGGGNVRLRSASGVVKAETGAGNIFAERCSSSVHAGSGGGNIEIGDVGGEVEMRTGGGRIKLGSAGGRVFAETGSGRIDLGRISGGVRAETGSGGIVAEIVAGNFADSELNSPSGDVIVYLSPQLAAEIRGNIEAASGYTIRSEFSEIRITSEGEWGPKTVWAEGRLNGGGPVLKVSTSSGNIEFRRLTH